MFFPDGEGNPQVISLAEPNDPNVRYSLAHDDPDSKITLWLYNKWEIIKNHFIINLHWAYFRQYRAIPRQLISSGVKNRDNFTLDENFEGKKKTKIIIHGWKNK